MGWLTSILERRAHKHPPSREEFFFSEGRTGIAVSPDSAMRLAAVHACVRVLAESVASLPLHLFRRLRPRGKERSRSHPLYRLLRYEPNPLMTSFIFFETMQAHLALRGNAYAAKIRNEAGQIAELWPIEPRCVTVAVTKSREVVYVVRTDSGKSVAIPRSDMFHVHGFSADGLVGLSPISLARSSISLALAAEEYGSRFFENDATPGGVLEHPALLNDEAYERLKSSFNEAHAGVGQAHRMQVLEEGMKWTATSISNEDAQFLETRKFQTAEIARIFRVPPHMIGDLERATFSNIEHQTIDFLVHTLRPWLVRWEQAIQLQLLDEADQKVFFPEFLVDGLLRGDSEARYKAYATARNWGWLSANDVRELENLNPVEDGDTYMQPLNMIPTSQVTRR